MKVENHWETTALSAPLREEIQKIYIELDAQVRALGVCCWVRGDCCDFEKIDHRLYASSLEVAYVLERQTASPPAEGPTSLKLCPFWREGKCVERGRRPIGCRTFFCDRRYREPLEALYEKFYRRLRDLAKAHSFPWKYLPFVQALQSHRPDWFHG